MQQQQKKSIKKPTNSQTWQKLSKDLKISKIPKKYFFFAEKKCYYLSFAN